MAADNQRFLQWLGEIGLDRHATVFEEQAINFDIAGDLTDSDLKDIGLSSLGDRKRFLKAIGERQASAPGAPSSAASTIPEGARPVIPQGERRQVTVLFADIAGYTALSSQRDPEEIHAMLNRFFDVADGAIREHGGTIDKHIGDAVMAVFGAPVAHTDDPLRAVLAALEVHRRLGALGDPIPVHIGIASGEVVASGTGSDKYQEYTVTGPSVNLASRLDGLAKAGETFVSNAVFEAVSGSVIGNAMGAVTVKGMDTPVSVWSIAGKRDQADRADQASTVKIFGRSSECAAFADAAASCLTEGTGRLLYLRGEPGIGKTALAESFRAIAQDKGFACLQAMILDFGAATGREAIRCIASGLIDPAAITPRDDKIDAAVASGLIAGSHAVHLYDLLDRPQPTPLRVIYDAMDNETRNRGRHETFDALVRGASDRQPLFITVDNLHWADDGTLSLLRCFVEQASQHPLMVVFTTRIDGDPWGDPGTDDAAQADYVTIDLRTLGQAEAIGMAETFGLTDPAFIEQCRQRAGGNPLFLEQLFRTTAADDNNGVGAHLPATVQSVVLARMDSLAANDRKALQAASVMGQRFSLDVLRSLLDLPNFSCDELVRRALVRPDGPSDGDHYLFAHALVADGAYGSMLSAQRNALHGKVAAWYVERDVILHAQHLDRAGRPEAARAYHAAAAQDVETYRYEPALRFIERGLELSLTATDRVPLLCLKGDVLLAMGQAEDSLSVFRAAVALAETPVDEVRARIGVAAGARIAGAVDDGLKSLDEAEQAAGDVPLHRERAQIYYYRGTLLFSRGDLAGGLAAQEEAIVQGRKADDPEWVARGLSGLGDAQYAYGKMRTAYATFLKCLGICETGGYGQIEVANHYMVLNMRRYMNEFREALEGMVGAVDKARQVENLRAEMFALILQSEFLTDAADYDAALDALSRALDIARSFDNKRMAAYVLDHQARALAGSARLAEAQAAIEEAWRNSQETDTTFFGARVCGTRALLALDQQARMQALADGEAIIEKGVLAHNLIWFLRDAIDASLSDGSWDMAMTYAARMEEATRAEPIPWCDFFIERGHALAAHGQGQGNHDVLEAVARRTRDIGLLAALPAIEAALQNAEFPRDDVGV